MKCLTTIAALSRQNRAHNFWPIFWFILLHLKFLDCYINIQSDVSVFYICLFRKLLGACNHFYDYLVICDCDTIGGQYVSNSLSQIKNFK